MRLMETPKISDRRRKVLIGTALLLLVIAFFGFEGTAAGPEVEEFDEFGDSQPLGRAFVLMLAALAGCIALGVPLFVIIGVLATMSFWLMSSDFQGLDTLDVFSDEVARMTSKTELLAIPFFVASGAIMSEGSIAKRLINLARALVGWMPGGLAVATVFACIFFAAISGSSPVTVIAIGSMAYPALLKAGYERRFTLGLVSSAGSLGILIPPSIPMLVFAIVAGGRKPLDVSELFLAGIVPGLLIAILLSLYSVFKAGKGTREKFDGAEVRKALYEGIWAMSLPLVILGGIYTGVFTPTEAAAVSVVYALLVEILIHRDITIRDIPKILSEAAVTMGTILIIMSLAVALNMFLVEEQIPNRAVAWIQSMDLSPVTFLLLVNLLLLAVGALMDSISAILIIAPLLAPIAYELGIDPVHLGIIFIVNLEIGYLTPPIGINLFVASSVFRRPMGEVSRGVLPFIGLMVVGLMAVTYIPSIALGPVNVLLRDKEFYEPFPGSKNDPAVQAAKASGGAGGAAGTGKDGGELAAPETQKGVDGKTIYSIEDLMDMGTETGDEDDDWDDDDDLDEDDLDEDDLDEDDEDETGESGGESESGG